MSDIWVCNICQQAMPVSYGPYHLVEDSHIARLIVHISAITKTTSYITTQQPATHELFSKDQTQYYPKAIKTLPAEIPAAAFRGSPINDFFASFPSFRYDPTITPSESYRLLGRHFKQHRHDSESKEIWERYQDALRKEFDLWYGSEDDLEAWHALCRAVEIDPLPTSCESCEEAVRNHHVNLIDLIHWGRNGGQRVKVFRTVRELSDYSRKNKKVFENTLKEKSEGGGVVLRHLLRHLWSCKEDKEGYVYVSQRKRLQEML